jgi:hypothetical protein
VLSSILSLDYYPCTREPKGIKIPLLKYVFGVRTGAWEENERKEVE